MQAIQYVKSVPRYLTARLLGPHLQAVYTSPFGTLHLGDVTAPRLPSPEWVRVRPRLSGICGSDLATLTAQGTTYFSPFTSCPFVLGHEVVGEVEEVGGGVRTLAKGQRVVLEPPLHCAIRGIDPVCEACRTGRTSHCLNPMRGALSAGIQVGFCQDTGGGWSRGFVAHESQLHPVPETLADDVAVLVEPFACCLHAALLAPLADHRTVVVMGAGTIGALTVAAIRATGSRCRILAVAKHPHQQRLATALGADEVIGTRDLQARLAQRLEATLYRPEIGGAVALGGADIVFECVGSEHSLDDALRFTRHHGSVILVGMPSIPKRIDWTAIWHKELTVRGAYTSTTPTFRRALEIVHGMRDRLAGIAAARFPLSRYRQAIDTALHAGREGVVKTVFEP